uniref:Elongator complex protein 2 n=1 Tax=Rhabditophanes sp. KR3021 TaxID=114890 RepID=A0AC35UD48_9BILA
MEDVFMGTGVAQMAHVMAWGGRGQGFFASANNVVVMSKKIPDHYSITSVRALHQANITCLKLVDGNKDLIVTGDDKGITKVHLVKEAKTGTEFELLQTFEGLQRSPVSCVGGIQVGGEVFILTASHKGGVEVKVGGIREERWSLLKEQRLEFGDALGLCVAFTAEPQLMLAIGLSTSKIAMAVWNGTTQQFCTAIQLSGHADWVRGLAFRCNEDHSLLLASASQDSLVRLWKFEEVEGAAMEEDDLELIRVRELIMATVRDGEATGYKVTVDSILSGHEGWIYSVEWHPTKLALMTCSIDKSIMIWEPIEGRGIWLEEHRLGQVGGQACGYYGACFAENGDEVMAHSYYGGLYCWKFDGLEDSWESVRMPSGHHDSVPDLDWDPRGNFLISCSQDQTTRIYAPFKNELVAEMARPQVHGHNLNCVKMICSDSFVSGAEEKIFRAFRGTSTFVNSAAAFTGLDVKELVDANEGTRAFGAAVPSLGLSNKAMEAGDMNEDVAGMEQDGDSNPVPKANDAFGSEMASFISIPKNLTQLPTEDYLMQNSLWPEIYKLYGHGYEVFAVDSSPDGKLIATSCKASHQMFASVIVWETEKWSKVMELDAHQLTVVQIRFSPCGRFLLTVSRDRTWTVYERSGEQWGIYARPEAKSANNHNRIIWCCDWGKTSNFFVTGARDKKLSVWKHNPEKKTFQFAFSHMFDEAVTAVAVCPQDERLLGVGFESGEMKVIKANASAFEVICSKQLHGRTVRRLKFRPITNTTTSFDQLTGPSILLASAGDDHLVRITKVDSI